jgi:hypothetical protein
VCLPVAGSFTLYAITPCALGPLIQLQSGCLGLGNTWLGSACHYVFAPHKDVVEWLQWQLVGVNNRGFS